MSDTQTFTGIVTELSSKVVGTTRKFRVHMVGLDSGNVINVGFKQPYAVGDAVSIPCEFKFGEWKMIQDGKTSAPSSSGTTAPSFPKKEYGSGKNTKFPVPKDHGDYSIIRQNALTNAVNTWRASVEATAPVSDEDVEAIIKIAYKFAEFSSGHREQRILKEMGVGAKSA